MAFLLEQGLEFKVVFVTLEEASFLLPIKAKAPALHVSERSLFKFCVNAITNLNVAGSSTGIAGSSCSGRATSMWSPNDIFHSGGDTSSNCQVPDYVDKYCALVELLDLCVSSENSLKPGFLQDSGEIGRE